jgi:hypothetical protein
MIKNPFYTAITVAAIALSATSLQAKESYSQNATDTSFVCATEIQTPTMFAYTPGAATTLQNLSQTKQPQYLKTQEAEDRTVVCMVNQENQNCNSENSVNLFSINPNYDAACVLDNKEPLECVAIGRVRGVYSIPDSPYTPSWWPW